MVHKAISITQASGVPYGDLSRCSWCRASDTGRGDAAPTNDPVPTHLSARCYLLRQHPPVGAASSRPVSSRELMPPHILRPIRLTPRRCLSRHHPPPVETRISRLKLYTLRQFPLEEVVLHLLPHEVATTTVRGCRLVALSGSLFREDASGGKSLRIH